MTLRVNEELVRAGSAVKACDCCRVGRWATAGRVLLCAEPRLRNGAAQQGYLQPVDAEPIEPGRVDEGMADEGSYEDSEPLVGEFSQEWEDDNSCVTHFSGNSLDDGGESIFSDGVFNNRGPLWYSNIAFTIMQRSAPTHQGTAAGGESLRRGRGHRRRGAHSFGRW